MTEPPTDWGSAIMALLQQGDGIAFDTQSLTEDYDIGFRLKAKGMPVLRYTTTATRFPAGASRLQDSQARAPLPGVAVMAL